MPPIGLEAASAEGSWDEERHAFALKNLAYRNGDTLIQLAGVLKAGPNEPWRLDLTGQNAVLGVVEPGDPALAVDTIEASLAATRAAWRLKGLPCMGRPSTRP
jgi:hypothetical protein